MASMQSMSACLILLALIACQAILSTEGRQIIKATNKKEAATSAKAILTQGERELLPPISYIESAAADINDFRPTTPGNSPGVGHSHHTQDVESKVDRTGAADDHSVDDFRPTTPGNSPGVGHSSHHTQGVESKMDGTGGAADHSVVDDFRPTTPGHSPGIGHALLNKNSEPKA